MKTYTMTPEKTVNSIKADIKADLMKDFLEFLSEKYEDVGMVRYGNTSKTNEIGFTYAVVDEYGNEMPVPVTVNPVVKDFKSYKTAKTNHEVFVLSDAKVAYDKYLEDKEAAEVAKSMAKSAKIAAAKTPTDETVPF